MIGFFVLFCFVFLENLDAFYYMSMLIYCLLILLMKLGNAVLDNMAGHNLGPSFP